MKNTIPVNINNKLYKDNKKYLALSLSQDFMMNAGLRINDFITVYFEKTEIKEKKFLKMIVQKVTDKNCQKWKIVKRSKSKSEDGEIRITISDSINEKIKNENFCRVDCEVLEIDRCKGCFSVLLPDFFISHKLAHNLSLFEEGLVNEEDIKVSEKSILNRIKIDKIKKQSMLHYEIANLNYYIVFLSFIHSLLKDLQTDNVYISNYKNKNYLFLRNGTVVKKIREKHLSNDSLEFMHNHLGSNLQNVLNDINKLIQLVELEELNYKLSDIPAEIKDIKIEIKNHHKSLKKEKLNYEIYDFE